jgi:hypothetical protein
MVCGVREDGVNILKGPADADHFRVKVGRYGDRWYCDPLPACDIAPATDDVWPSISTVKKASGQDWSYVSMKRCAAYTAALTLAGQRPSNDTDDVYEAFKAADKKAKNLAFNRGTIIHLWFEDLLNGRLMRDFTEWGELAARNLAPAALEEALQYQGAITEWFAQHQPELVAAEIVCIHRDLNGVGYGGTADAIVNIDGKLYLVDWKSRGSDHDAYPEEAGQVAALAGAQYMIIEGASGPVRSLIPELAGGLIVSIKTDGCRTYPVML